MFVLALNQGRQFIEAVGFKQEPKEMSFYGLLASSEICKSNGQFIRKKHLAGYCTQFCNWSLGQKEVEASLHQIIIGVGVGLQTAVRDGCG